MGLLEERLKLKEAKDKSGTRRSNSGKRGMKRINQSSPALGHHSFYYLTNFSFELFCVCIPYTLYVCEHVQM